MDKMLFEFFFYPNIPYQSSRSETKGRNQMVGQPELVSFDSNLRQQ